MKISAALHNVNRLYIDTAPLIYYVETNPTYTNKMDAIIKTVESTPIQVICSVIILTEVLTHPLKQGNKKLEREYRDILLHSDEFHLEAATIQIAELAANLRVQYNLRTPDSLHIATAIDHHCEAFLTNDMGLKRVTEITVLALDELER